MKYHRCSLSIVLAFIAIIHFSNASRLFARNSNDYLQTQITSFNKYDFDGANKNWSITTDSTGYTYFGNDIGLLEFDGVSWSFYPSNNGFAIRSVKSYGNRIYSGGYKELGYWERNDLGNLVYTSLTAYVDEHLALNEEFWDISVVNGEIFFRSFSAVYIYNPEHGFKVKTINGFISRSCILDDEYYIAVSKKGIFKYGNYDFEPLANTDFFKDKVVILFEKTEKPDIYFVGTESHGIFHYNLRTDTAVPWGAEYTSLFIRNKIDKSIIGVTGDIVIGTILNGIFLLDKAGRLKGHFCVENGLQSNTIHALDYDQRDNLIATSDKGIDYISFNKSQKYTAFYHNDIGTVYSAALFNNMLYLGTNQGLFRRSWDEHNQTFTLVAGTQRQVWDCTIVDNQLFVGHNSGTFIIDKDHNARRIQSSDGGSSITRVPNKPDYLIQSTYSNLLVYKKQANNWVLSASIKGFNDLIQSIEFDHRMNLWASHPYRGIYKIRLNEQLDSITQMNYYGKDSHLWNPGNNIRVFKIDNRIVFTNGQLIYTFDDLNDTIKSYDNLNEHLGQYASSFLIVKGFSNDYWFLCNSGIALFKIEGENIIKVKEFPVMLFHDDLVPGHESLIPIDKEKSILCLENGYAILDATIPDYEDKITTEIPVLRKITINTNAGEERSLPPMKNEFSLPFSHNNLTVQYSFPFCSGQELSYQYWVEGLTEQWSEYISSPVVIINRIPPGKYNIKIRAINNWQISSQVLETPFRVKPSIYQSFVAKIIYFLLGLTLVYLFQRTIKRRLKLKELQRWEEKEQELIRQKNKELQNDLSFKSQQLALSALSMAKKNETLLEIKNNLTQQREQLGSRYPEKFFKEITRKIDKGITGDDEWKVFENNFKQAHATFLHQLKDAYPELTPSDLKLCTFLRINLASKEIAPLLGISVRGVENHRYRIRKKLNLAAEDDLAEFLFTFPDERTNKPESK
jgi:DNA-binding CsgD family transcriptional regulator